METNSLLKIELSNYKAPMFLDSSRKDWVSYGNYNEYPMFLIDLMNQHPEHGAILKGKANYVFGKGLAFGESETVLDQARREQWLNSANRFQTWNDVLRKTTPQFELYNGWAWQIIWNNGGTNFEVFNIEFGKLRRSKDKRKVYYCDEWMVKSGNRWVPNSNPEKSESYKEFDVFNPNVRTGTQILYIKVDEPTVVPNGDLYPLPVYSQAIMEIETDINISKLRYHYSANGMFAQSLISFFNGEPSKEEKKAIKKMFDRTYGSPDNAGQLIFSFNDKGGTAPSISTLTQSDLDKVFADTRKECQDKIFSAHLTAPVLFGIKTEGSLSDSSGEATLKEWDKFVRTYIEGRQEFILTEIKNLADLQGNDFDDLYIKQTAPVGLEVPLDPNVLALFNEETKRKYFANKYNIEIVEEESTDVNGQPLVTVNENLKKLSGRDWQHIKRMIREVKNGKTDRTVASLMLKNAYALTDSDINVLFATNDAQFSKFEIEQREEDFLLGLFASHCVDDTDDETVSEVFMGFATEDEKKNSVLEILKGNPSADLEKVAKDLGITKEDVLSIITSLVAAGLLLNVGNAYQPTEKAIKKETEIEIETYVVYKYETRPNVPATSNGRSRRFCQLMMALSRAGKRWTKEGIDKIQASAIAQKSMPEDWNAWDYRGGFYSNPNTGETTPFCRHAWVQITKTRRKK